MSVYFLLHLFFLNKQSKCFIVFIFCCEFPTVYSERSEHHGHCTEGSGSGQYSGLGEWKSDALKMRVIFSFITELNQTLICVIFGNGTIATHDWEDQQLDFSH